jgi:galactonate dehydratase
MSAGLCSIIDVRTVLLTGPCSLDPFLVSCRAIRSAAFIEIITSQPGVIGIGETYAGYFLPEAVPTIVDFLKPILLGVDPLAIGPIELRQRMERCAGFWCNNGFGAAVIVGIEAACWDLRGKLLGKPVHELLGGAKHKRLLCYATGGPSNWPPAKLRAKADHYINLGFRAFKIGAGYLEDRDSSDQDNTALDRSAQDCDSIAEQERQKFQMLRDHLGDEIGICIDAHMANNQPGAKVWDVKTAIAVAKAIEPYNPTFLEEPLPYSDIQVSRCQVQ